MWEEAPGLVLVNGPGTCIPICLAAFLLRLLGRNCMVVYIESIARVAKLSLSGWLLYSSGLADAIFVQWPELQAKYPHSIYAGRGTQSPDFFPDMLEQDFENHSQFPRTRTAFRPTLPLKSRLPGKSHSSRLVSAAKKQEIQQKVSKWSLLGFLRPKQKEPEPPAPEPKWGLLNWAAYNQAWQVPWGRKELAIGLFSWAISFVAVGIVLVPIIGFAAGVKDFKSLTSSDKSFYALVNQVIETIVGIAVINAAVSKAGPLEDDIFKLDFRAPLNKPNGWLFWGILGVVAAPVVVGACATLVSAVGYEDLVTDKRGTVDGVAQMLNIYRKYCQHRVVQWTLLIYNIG
ncbi:hypothetical protein WJX82_007065 [Trebouxia sp. C0006]